MLLMHEIRDFPPLLCRSDIELPLKKAYMDELKRAPIIFMGFSDSLSQSALD
jgi:hypothetical protein